MEKRTIMALAIAFLVMAFYPTVLEHFYPGYGQNARQHQQPQATTSAAPSEPQLVKAADTGPAPAMPSSAGASQSFDTKKLNLVFYPEQAVIRRLGFTAYKLSILESNDAALSPLYLDFLKSPGEPGAYALDLTDPLTVRAVAATPALSVTKSLVFKKDAYDALLSVRLENTSDAPQTLQYRVLVAPSIPPRGSIDQQYIEANFCAQDNQIRHIRESKAGKQVPSGAPVRWVAMKDRHFAVILRPLDGKFHGLVEGHGKNRFAAWLVSPEFTLAPRESREERFVLYAGPADAETLAPLGLDGIVNFGKLDGIGKIMVGLLEILNKVFRNYGVSIIMLTVLINILLFPLTRASYMSMKRMQLIQPQMAKLKEKHGKNPQKLNQEMMELYKKHKVNPFGGCLPMLLQMPVFIALYVALSKAVILRGSRFLWIHDLSSPDVVPLPVRVPFIGEEIHLLPIIMCVAMVLQQKFTQVKIEGQDPQIEAQQRMMTAIMPVMFLFIFYTMPSGLVLYWLTNTLLMASYQLRLKRMTLT